MGIMDGFLQQLGTGDTVRDYTHASKLFVGNNFELAPKMEYLYHVFFDLDPSPGVVNLGIDQVKEAGMLVKSVDLPKFTVETKTLNSYNKPNIVQNKIKYDPVNLTFHDDNADVVRSLWADYFTYYYRDMDSGTTRGVPSNQYFTNTKYGDRTADYGFTTRKKSSQATNQYIRAIRIYSLHKKRFSEYILVNPTITSFKHGRHEAGTSNPMQCDMTVSFEFVLYTEGYVSSDTVKGFADLHYDKQASPLSPANGTRSILGPGGLIDAASDVFGRINSDPPDPLGAALSAFRGLKNASAMDLKSAAKGELLQAGRDLLNGENPLNRYSIPAANALTAIGSQLSKTLSGGSEIGFALSNGESLASNALAVTAGTELPPSFVNFDDILDISNATFEAELGDSWFTTSTNPIRFT